MQTLQQALLERIFDSGAEIALAFQTLDRRYSLFINSQAVFHAASTMKLAVMMELFRQAHAQKLKLDDVIPIKNEFFSVVDQTSFSVSLETPEEIALANQAQATLYDLCHAMMTVSSNLATNLLMAHIGVRNINLMLRLNGIAGMNVVRALEDLKAFAKGMNNTTDANALVQQLIRLARHDFVSPDASKHMLDILKQQQFRDGIPAGLPAAMPVAHKTGEITRHHHDAGIVYAPKPYVIVVLTRGFAHRTESANFIAEISHMVYEMVQRE
jgi:beta-lactamase class A